jgi:hypothetical protein
MNSSLYYAQANG